MQHTEIERQYNSNTVSLVVAAAAAVTTCLETHSAADCLLQFMNLHQYVFSYLCTRSNSALPAEAGA